VYMHWIPGISRHLAFIFLVKSQLHTKSSVSGSHCPACKVGGQHSRDIEA
jgi:hypothetical protein